MIHEFAVHCLRPPSHAYDINILFIFIYFVFPHKSVTRIPCLYSTHSFLYWVGKSQRLVICIKNRIYNFIKFVIVGNSIPWARKESPYDQYILVGAAGFEPAKPKGNGFTVRPSSPSLVRSLICLHGRISCIDYRTEHYSLSTPYNALYPHSSVPCHCSRYAICRKSGTCRLPSYE